MLVKLTHIPEQLAKDIDNSFEPLMFFKYISRHRIKSGLVILLIFHS